MTKKEREKLREIFIRMHDYEPFMEACGCEYESNVVVCEFHKAFYELNEFSKKVPVKKGK